MGVLLVADDGSFYRAASVDDPPRPVTLPSGISLQSGDHRPSFVRYRLGTPNATYGDGLTNSYIEGLYNHMLVVCYDGTLAKAGFTAPVAAPTLAQGAGTTYFTGPVIACFTPAQYANGVLIAEGNPSPKTGAVTFTGGQAQISGIPGTAPDARTTHWHVYLSVNGSISYRAATVTLGITTATVAMTFAELAQNESLPLMLDEDGNETDDVLARGTPPYARIHLNWKNRDWFVDPTRAGVWYSALFEMESVNEDEERSFIPTPGGEYPIAIAPLDDELVVYCETVIYSITGSGESTFRIRKVSDGVRLIAPYAIVNIQGIQFFASDQGICGYFGGGGAGIRNLMSESWRKYWISLYRDNREAFENATAADDMRFGDYVFVPDTTTTRTIRGFYRPMTEKGEAEPWWYFGDVRNRRMRSIGQSYTANSHEGFLTYGECNGKTYIDDDDDGTDDGDSYNKRMRIMHKHFFMGDQGGDDAHGRTYTNLDWFGLQNDNTVTVNCYGGDDTANQATTPTFTGAIEPLVDVPGQETQATSRSIPTPELSGKGVTVEIVADNPIGVEHRGFAILHREGPQVRG